MFNNLHRSASLMLLTSILLGLISQIDARMLLNSKVASRESKQKTEEIEEIDFFHVIKQHAADGTLVKKCGGCLCTAPTEHNCGEASRLFDLFFKDTNNDFRLLYDRGSIIYFFHNTLVPLAKFPSTKSSSIQPEASPSGSSILFKFQVKPDHVFLLEVLRGQGVARLYQSWVGKWSQDQWLNLESAARTPCIGIGHVGEMVKQFTDARSKFGGGQLVPIDEFTAFFADLDTLLLDTDTILSNKSNKSVNIADKEDDIISDDRCCQNAEEYVYKFQAENIVRTVGSPVTSYGRIQIEPEFMDNIIPMVKVEWNDSYKSCSNREMVTSSDLTQKELLDEDLAQKANLINYIDRIFKLSDVHKFISPADPELANHIERETEKMKARARAAFSTTLSCIVGDERSNSLENNAIIAPNTSLQEFENDIITPSFKNIFFSAVKLFESTFIGEKRILWDIVINELEKRLAERVAELKRSSFNDRFPTTFAFSRVEIKVIFLRLSMLDESHAYCEGIVKKELTERAIDYSGAFDELVVPARDKMFKELFTGGKILAGLQSVLSFCSDCSMSEYGDLLSKFDFFEIWGSRHYKTDGVQDRVQVIFEKLSKEKQID